MPQKIIIIADPGIDTAFAIALGLLDPKLHVLALAATVPSAGCGSSASDTAPTGRGPVTSVSSSTSKRPAQSHSSKPKAKRKPVRHASLSCAAPADVLAGVYRPYRLHDRVERLRFTVAICRLRHRA